MGILPNHAINWSFFGATVVADRWAAMSARADWNSCRPYTRPLYKVLRNTTCRNLAKPRFACASMHSVYSPCSP